MKRRIVLSGCDDSTYIDIDLTKAQLLFVQMLATRSEAESSYYCQPTLKVLDPQENK